MTTKPISLPILIAELARCDEVLQTPGLTGKRSRDELTALAHEFHEILDGRSEKRVVEAFRMHKTRSPWFPSPAHIVNNYNELVDRKAQRLALPAPTELPEEQVKINRRGLAMLRERMNRKKGGLRV